MAKGRPKIRKRRQLSQFDFRGRKARESEAFMRDRILRAFPNKEDRIKYIESLIEALDE